MRAQPKLRVLIGIIVLVFGVGGGASDVFAQMSGAPETSEVENL